MSPTSRAARRALAALVSVLLVTLAGCGDDSGEGSPALEGMTRDDPISVADVAITEVAPGRPGQPFRFRADDGELLFVYFGYTSCPDVCPVTLTDLSRALDLLDPELAADLSVAFVTVDPARDTAEVLVPYLGHFFDRVHALRTEDPTALSAVESAFGASSTITPNDDGTYEVSHTAISYVVDSGGDVVVEWPYDTSSSAMARDLQILFDAIRENRT